MLILIGIFIAFGSFLGGRALARRLLRIDGVRLMSREAGDAYFAVPAAQRALWRLAGPIATAAVTVALSFASLRARGQEHQTNTVDVLPGAPAAEFGVRPGDEIVAVAGVPVRDWGSIQGRLAAAGPHQQVPLVVSRNGSETTIQVYTNKRGRIGIVPRTELNPYPAGPALAAAAGSLVTVPLQVTRGVGINFGERTELSGPVGIVREVSAQRSARPPAIAFALMLVAFPAAMTWPISLVLALVLAPRRRRSPMPAPGAL
jgi:membrane-associated protease RseP (regulator of RpoE activity)